MTGQLFLRGPGCDCLILKCLERRSWKARSWCGVSFTLSSVVLLICMDVSVYQTSLIKAKFSVLKTDANEKKNFLKSLPSTPHKQRMGGRGADPEVSLPVVSRSRGLLSQLSRAFLVVASQLTVMGPGHKFS